MYCVSCGNPLSQGLSYCNRCGTNLKERVESTNTAAITALVTAITILGIAGLAIMMGGAVVLRKEAGLPMTMIGFFMLFTFLILGITEVMLVRSVTKLIGKEAAVPRYVPVAQPPLELRPPSAVSFAEPVNSVTENTTRTLQYSRREQ